MQMKQQSHFKYFQQQILCSIWKNLFRILEIFIMEADESPLGWSGL